MFEQQQRERRAPTATATREIGRPRFAGGSSRLRSLIPPHRPGYRDSGTHVLTGPQACPSGATIREMRTVYRVVYGRYAASHTAAPCARALTSLRVPGAVL